MDYNNNRTFKSSELKKMIYDENLTETTSQANGQFKLNLNSNLIHSDSSTLPDELKSLGVCAYDERTFERGLLDQMDLQIAEYESNYKQEIDGSSSEEEEEEASELVKNTPIKRKLSQANELNKKVNIGHDGNDLIDFDEESCGISYSPLGDEEGNDDIEKMIKAGDMTPFGTVVDFKKNSKAATINGKKTSSIRDKKEHKFDQNNDFDSFLMEFDTKKKTKVVQKKSKSDEIPDKKSPQYKSTNSTDFDMFLSAFDSTKPDKPKLSKKSKSVVKIEQPCTSKEAQDSPATEQKKQEIPKKKLDFESQLLELDNSFSVKKKKVLNKSKSVSSITITKLHKPNNEPKSKETPNKKVSKLPPLKSHKTPQTKKPSSDSKPIQTIDTNSFMEIFESTDTTSSQENNFSIFGDLADENDLDDPDYDALSNKSDTESEYVTDDDEVDPITARKRKRRLKRTCMDDGDDEIYLKRMKTLERYERSLLRSAEADEDMELNDPDEMSKSINDELDVNENTDNKIDLTNKNIIINNNRHVELDSSLKVPENIWNKLYKFQKTGLKWLWELHLQRCGGILGDEMGLGKTVQISAYLASLKYSRIRSVGFNYIGLGPVLIITPLTLIGQWVNELHNWWPYFRVNVLHEIGTCMETPRRKLIDKTFDYNGILITTYASLHIYDSALLSKNWHYVIMDEGHKIRNPDAKITIISKCFRTPHRIILSGSPIQNNLKELWSLFDFVFPGKLGTIVAFMENFSVPINQGGYSNASEIQVQTAYKCACILRNTIAPYLLRRVKNDVKMSLDLPNKNEQILFCRLSKEQKSEYINYINSRECQYMIKKKTNMLAALVQLRKICNHSDIITDKHYKNPQWVNHSDYDLVQAGNRGYFKRSGKMIVVDTLLKLWKKQDGRVLLFSQSREMLDILETYVKEQEYEYLRMDGSTAGSLRAKMVDNFNRNSSIFLFLLTTKVGGLGLNLIGANKIIIFDPDWNPTNDLQARERAWRIGQTRNVTIYRLLTSGTIEEKIYHRQIFKTFLSNKILKDPRQKRFFKTNDMHELFTFTCVDDSSVESSALLAGTGSEIKAKKLKAKYIPNVAKIRNGNKEKTRDNQAEVSYKETDDYVLSKLFKAKKKNGGQSYIHTALQHDKVVDNTFPDFSLVEQEADRIAKDAIKKLKNSRKYCKTADSGIPNLTGIKFGSKLKISSIHKPSEVLSNSQFKSDSNNSNTNVPINISSMSLLDRIKLRNKGIHQEKEKTHVDEDAPNAPDDSITDMANLNPIERSNKMSNMIKEYFSTQTTIMNRATTREVVEFFKKKTLKEDGPKFKAILKNMCDFNATTGVWSLKDEYFNL